MSEGLVFGIQRDSFTSAFALLNAAVDNVTSNMCSSLQHSAVADAYFDLLVKIASVRQSAKAAADAITAVLRGWSVHCISTLLFNCLVFLNPRLNASQQAHLLLVTSRTMEHFLSRGYLDEQLIRSLVTLASPDHGTCMLLNYLIEVITGLVSKDKVLDADQQPDPEQQQELQEDREIAHILIKQHAIDKTFVAAMSPGVRKAVFRALRRGDASGDQSLQQHKDSSPICCITLEPLLWPDCTVTLDVVAVIQRNHMFGRDHHAFLYRGIALQDWLDRNQVPVTPETRSIVKPGDVYRLS